MLIASGPTLPRSLRGIGLRHVQSTRGQKPRPSRQRAEASGGRLQKAVCLQRNFFLPFLALRFNKFSPSVQTPPVAEMRRREQQKVRVVGAGEAVLNGLYQCSFFTEFRIEYRHTENKNCTLFFTASSGEWRLACNGYKAGNTLYRNPLCTKTHEVPAENWCCWFGKAEPPTVATVNELEALVPEDSAAEPEGGKSTAIQRGEDSPRPSDGAGGQHDQGEAEAQSDEGEARSSFMVGLAEAGREGHAGDGGGAPSGAGTSQRQERFLEFRPILAIVPETDQLATGGGPAVGDKTPLVQEVEDPAAASSAAVWRERKAAVSPALLEKQLGLLLSTGEGRLPEKWEGVVTTKNAGNAAFTEEKIKTALECFSRAIVAAEAGVVEVVPRRVFSGYGRRRSFLREKIFFARGYTPELCVQQQF